MHDEPKTAAELVREAAKPFVQLSLKQRLIKSGGFIRRRSVAKMLLSLAKKIEELEKDK